MKKNAANTRILVLGFGLVVSLLIAIVIFSMSRIEQSRQIIDRFITEHQGNLDLIDRMYSASRQRIVVLQQIAVEPDIFVQDELVQEFSRLAGVYIEARDSLVDRQLSHREQELINLQNQRVVQILPIQAEVIELALGGQHTDAQLLLVNEVMPSHSELLENLVTLTNIQTVELRRTMDATSANESRTIYLLLITGGITVLLGIAIGVFVEQKMRQLTNHLAFTADSLSDSLRELEYQKLALDEHAIVSATDAEGVLTYVNEKFCRISQYSSQEIIGHTHKMINSGVHDQSYFAEFWKTIQSGNVWSGQICNRRKDGSVYWCSTTVVPFLDESGVPYRYVGVQTDITSAKEAEAVLARGKEELEKRVMERTTELHERQLLLQEITSSAQDAIILVDDTDEITFWNQAAEKTFGYTRQEAMGRKLHDLIMPPRYRNDFEKGFSHFIHTGEGNFIGCLREVDALRRDGSEFPVELALSATKIKGRWTGIGLARDITLRKQAEEALRQLALTDPLTGVANRRKLDSTLEVEVHRVTRYRISLVLVLFDVDHFKSINDRFGHQAGDEVLCKLAMLVAGSLRSSDLFARWGGEEFAILAPNCDLQAGQSCAEKIRQQIMDFDFSAVGHVTCSFGVAEFRVGENIAEFASRADQALYMAKSAGRNCVEIS